MYSIFVDETGINDKYTLLGGVIIHSEKYLKLSENIDQSLIKIFGKKSINLKEIRRKVYSNNSFTEKQYATFSEEYYSILEKHKPLFLLTGVSNSYCTDKKMKIEKSYKILLERFEMFLREKGSFGQIVFDHSDCHFKEIHEEHKRLINKGSSWGWEYRHINNIYAQSDEECRLLQIADLLSYSCHCHFNRRDSRHFKKCHPFFRKGPKGNIEGYGIKTIE